MQIRLIAVFVVILAVLAVSDGWDWGSARRRHRSSRISSLPFNSKIPGGLVSGKKIIISGKPFVKGQGRVAQLCD
ncbi:Hypp5869 [Branchiostoma lanceolatum]|uniref:Hypp5869 protein n=1 Tax=Branchiostoma lanceolatum TaxID=7740 RepID=A0A8J9VHX1_BRALA|nr:Hypp5869 [Branchiostoma lanceolatum]